MSHPHTYTSRLSWQGSTGVGYDAYDRTHRVATPPADGEPGADQRPGVPRATRR